MIAKLEWKQSSTQQNIVQLLNPTMGATTNNESTKQQNHRLRTDNSLSHWGGGGGGLKCILLVPLIQLLLKHKILSSHGGFLTVAMKLEQ